MTRIKGLKSADLSSVFDLFKPVYTFVNKIE
jgi:hypothetical protein